MSTTQPASTSTSVIAETESDAATDGLILGLTIGGITLAICLVLYEVLRRWVPVVYEYRRVLKESEDDASRGYYGELLGTCPEAGRTPIIGWISSTLRITPRELEKTHGLDAAFFVRFLRSRVVLFTILSFLSCVLLLPVYWTGPNRSLSDGEALKTRGIQRFSMGNISVDDRWRFWYSFSVYVISVVFTTGTLYLDYVAYTAARRRYRAGECPANFACLVLDIPREKANEDDIQLYWENIFPGEISYVHQARNAKKLLKKKERWLKAVTKRERMQFIHEKTGERPTQRVNQCRGSTEDSNVDSIKFWMDREDHYKEKIALCQRMRDEEHHVLPLQSAIIVFKTKRSSAVASQVQISRKIGEWRTCRAPEPNAVNWSSLGMGSASSKLFAVVSATAIVALTLFWIIPVISIQGLANLSALSQIEIAGARPFQFLEVVRTWSAGAVAFIEGLLPPIIHAVFLSLVPVFIRLLCGLCRVPSLGKLETMAAPKLIEMVSEADVKAFANVLAKAVPSQGTFFMTFVTLQALSTVPQMLVQIPRVALRWIFRRFLSKTQRELKSRDAGGSLFLYFRHYALAQLVSVIGLVYCIVSPLVVPCCLLYYMTSYAVHTHNIAYSTVQPFSDAGSMFPGSIGATFVALVFQGLILGGIFALNGQGTQSTLSFIGAALSLALHYGMHKEFSKIAEQGSLLQTLNTEKKEDGVRKIRAEVARHYMHPALIPLREESETGDVERVTTSAPNQLGSKEIVSAAVRQESIGSETDEVDDQEFKDCI